jgi:hypothetical protein
VSLLRTVINNFTFVGSTKDAMQQAARDALIAFMAATAQAQAEATKAAHRAGIEHAKQHGERTYLGRKPSYTRQQYDRARPARPGGRRYRTGRQGDRADAADGLPHQGRPSERRGCLGRLGSLRIREGTMVVYLVITAVVLTALERAELGGISLVLALVLAHHA